MNHEEIRSLKSCDGVVSLEPSDRAWTVKVDGVTTAYLREESSTSKSRDLVLIDAAPPAGRGTARWMLTVLYAFFGTDPSLARIVLDLEGRDAMADEIVRGGLAFRAKDRAGVVVCDRSMFWQHPDLFLRATPSGQVPLFYKMTANTRHPVRSPNPPGEVYRRWIPEFSQWVSLRTIDAERDLDLFHRWHNDPRVAFFWELAGSREMHSDYIRGLLADEHVHPLLVCFDDEPCAYVEMYWGKEDRLGPYYQADDYDRGFHALVGEQRFRGPQRVAAWMSSVNHYMFLDDPRTRRLVGEPRASNDKLIGYLFTLGWYRQKEFDFPHKRAAMVMCEREAFFEQYFNGGAKG